MTSTTAPLTGPSTQLRRARAAVGVLFFTNGAVFANLLPRYPAIKADLHLSNAQFGFSVAAFPAGALVAGLGAGALIRRFGSPATAICSTLIAALAILSAGVAPTGLLLAVGLFVGGAMDSITDVAQNSHGLRVQRLYGRSILNSFHAIWSIGAVTGGALGALAAALDLPRAVHLGLSAAVVSALALLARGFLLHGDDDAEPEAVDSIARAERRATPRLMTYAALGLLFLIAASGAVVEDAGASWSAIYLSGSLHSTAFVAGTGFIALQSAMFVGRIFGDRMVDAFGQRTMARAGGALIFLGMGGALLVDHLVAAVVGFGLAGLGAATLVPAAMHGADQLPGLKPGTGLTIVSWLLRIGFLLSPPLVGAVADAESLRVGLSVVPVAGATVLLSAGVLAGRARTARPEADADTAQELTPASPDS